VIAVTDESFPQLVERSKQVPVLIDLWATWCEPCKQLSPVLIGLARDYEGRFVLATIDIDANPQVARAFGVQSVPAVVALIAGQAAPLFVGAQPAERIRPLIDEVLKVAASQGVTGRVAVSDGSQPRDDAGRDPASSLSPAHRRAAEAIEAGDLDAAAEAYREALADNPGDADAKVALEGVELMRRVDGVDFDAVFAAAAADPTSVDKALAAADLEVASGAAQAAFDRLLPLIRSLRGDEREPVRARLVEYFDIVGVDDPQVTVARRALASALF
jgi:putative thioredoxin